MQLAEQAVSSEELTAILGALNALKRGDASIRLPQEWTGLMGRVSDAFNDVVERNARMAEELARLSRVVGKEGKLNQRGTLGDVTRLLGRVHRCGECRSSTTSCIRPAKPRA